MTILGKPLMAKNVATGSFDPSAISGYEMHMIAESNDGSYNDGDTPSPWPDETGTYSLSPSNTPTLEKNELNSRSIIRFVGASSERYRDTSPLINFATTYSLVYVMKDTSTGTKIILRSSVGSEILWYSRDSGNIIEVNCGNGTQSYQVLETSPSPARGNWWVMIVTCDFDNGNLYLYLNSDSATQSSTGNTTGAAPSDAYINIPADASYPDMDLAEFIVYNGHILTAQEIADFNDHFTTKYGISHV